MVILCAVCGTHAITDFHMIPGQHNSQSKHMWSAGKSYDYGWCIAFLPYTAFCICIGMAHLVSKLSLGFEDTPDETVL